MTDEHKAPGKPRAVLTLNGRPLPGKPVIATPGTPMPRAISSVNGKDRPSALPHACRSIGIGIGATKHFGKSGLPMQRAFARSRAVTTSSPCSAPSAKIIGLAGASPQRR
ncbi:hypothetical protein [Sphingomonas sp. Ant20]|uniref:hypothetical protein n=1 Tax=Sphingomonas sp. Ant20 TaxID=104605 RepID=UPI0018E2D450|nr:hypothetical protein [Sphingomonas sp. Ant20]